MRKLLLALIPMMITSAAFAQQPPSQFAEVNDDWTALLGAKISMVAAIDHLQKSLQMALTQAQQAGSKEAYWRDACTSTPECGGAK